MKKIGDRLEAKFPGQVEVKYVYNILDLGYRGEDILWLVEHYTSGVLVVLAMVNVAVIVLAAVAVTRHLRRTPVVVRLASA